MRKMRQGVTDDVVTPNNVTPLTPEDVTPIVLDNETFEKFIAKCENPDKPNKALKDAVRYHYSKDWFKKK